MSKTSDDKAEARKAAFARRKAAFHDPCGAAEAAQAHLRALLSGVPGTALAGYMPIRTEIDPLPVMTAQAAHGPVGVPVIRTGGAPLWFARWHPGIAMAEGPFGVRIPVDPRPLVPRILIVPLVAFSRTGGRLGYGGGFYDRTLSGLRAAGPCLAIGFAFAAQEDPDLPLGPTDARLDLVVTEHGPDGPHAANPLAPLAHPA